MLTLAVAGVVVCGLGGGIYAGVASGASQQPEKQHNSVQDPPEMVLRFAGKTDKSGNRVTHVFSCPSGSYVKNSGSGSGTIFDEPYVNTAGSNQFVKFSHSSESSVDWGHWGSKLSTAIAVGAQGNLSHLHDELPFVIEVTCTTEQKDAWVILG